MLLSNNDAFILKEDYLALDAGTICMCQENEADTEAEFAILAATPIGLLLIPCDKIRAFTMRDYERIYGRLRNELAQ